MQDTQKKPNIVRMLNIASEVVLKALNNKRPKSS